jgi:peptide/nickel transport system permease protein
MIDPRRWRRASGRLGRDRLTFAAGIVIAALLLAVFAGPPIAERVLGHGPDDIFPYAVDLAQKPVGPWTRVPDVHLIEGPAAPPHAKRTLLVLGGDGPLGRDEFLRLLNGGRTSLEVALGATLLALLVGVVAGAAAGYFGGWVDAVFSRATEFVMAFPVLLFLIMLGSTVGDFFDQVTLSGFLERGVVSLIVLIAAFTWYYPARIIRARVIELREREFVEASRSLGAGPWRIMRTHLLPHLWGPIVVYGTLMIGTNILLEAGVTFLGVGLRLPTASWGSLLSSAWGGITNPVPSNPSNTIWLTLFPSLGIMLSVMAFNLLGEGLRESLE